MVPYLSLSLWKFYTMHDDEVVKDINFTLKHAYSKRMQILTTTETRREYFIRCIRRCW